MPLKKPSKIPSEKPSAKSSKKLCSKYDLQTVHDSQQDAIKPLAKNHLLSVSNFLKKSTRMPFKEPYSKPSKGLYLSFSIFPNNTINMPLKYPYSKPIKKPSNKNCLVSKKKFT